MKTILAPMRREFLQPPRELPASEVPAPSPLAAVPAGAAARAGSGAARAGTAAPAPGGRVASGAGARALPHDRLREPRAAAPRRRHLFHPATGWFRRLERRASQFLSGHVFPWVPGMRIPYSRQLDRQLTLSETEIPIAGLPEAFAGLRVLLVTDLHAGPFLRRRSLAAACRRLQALEPDLILLGGDLLTGHLKEFRDIAHALDELRAPLGRFAVLGNHDHYAGSTLRIRRWLDACGVETLHNRSVRLERGGAGLTLAGIDDHLVGDPDLDAALDGAEPPVLLLSHNPDVFFDAARAGVALTLAGHTHAGQIRLPGLPVLVRQSRYRLDEGRYRFEGSELLVSRGLGAVGLPWRLHCPPEAVLLTLRGEPAEGIRRLQQV